MMMSSPVALPDRVSGFRSRAINGILAYLESLRPISSRTVRHEWRTSGVVSHASAGGELPNDLSSFYIVSAPTATTRVIGAGHFVIAGVGAWEAAQATVTLSGATAYVYLVSVRSTRETYIATSTISTYPQHPVDQYRIALYKFTSSDGGASYQLARDCRHDIRMGAPV
jgi:hypothetical protein